MLKTLLKKQLSQITVWLFVDRKSGKTRSKGMVVAFAVLYAVLFLIFGGMSFVMGYSICTPLVSFGMDWLYFAIMGIAASVIAVIGSAFTTYSSLYAANDNELLLSLPIKPSLILTVRLMGVWLWCFIYEFIIFFPSILVYLIFVNFGILNLIFGILIMIILSFFVLSVSCALGYAIAVINTKLKNKSFIIVLFSLAFVGIYYSVSTKFMQILNAIIDNAQTIGDKIKGFAYLFYCLGRGCEGKIIPFMIFTLIVGAVFGVLYFVMSRSFLKLATTNRTAKGKKYVRKTLNKSSVNKALLVKELKRFLISPVYILNCAFGTVFLILLGGATVVKGGMLREVVAQFQVGALKDAIPAIACLFVCILTTMNDITAPSISLEGKNLWLLQSLPVSPLSVFRAKITLHLLITQIPAVFCSVCLAVVLRLDLLSAVIITVLPLALSLLSAVAGLAINLKMPNLDWNNETVPVKQDFCVLLTMLVGFGTTILLGVLCFFGRMFINILLILAVYSVILFAVSALLLKWLKVKGTKIFSSL